MYFEQERQQAVAARLSGALRRIWPQVFVLATILASCLAGLALSAYVLWFASISPLARAGYFLLFLCLFYCCLAYQVNRFGTALRQARHRPFREAEFAPYFGPEAPTVTILIPTFREERRVLRMTLLSAALARYSLRRIVVLIDDPPDSGSVAGSRAVVEEVRRLLLEPMEELRNERQAFAERRARGRFDADRETRHVAALNLGVADWLYEQARDLGTGISPSFRHVDQFNVDRVVLELARYCEDRSRSLDGRRLDEERLQAEHDRLATLFCTEISSFERKQFANLSHAPNKAMNLNSYIGLMGGAYASVAAEGKSWLVAAAEDEATLDVPASTYVLTLDADSVILNDYILDLVHVMQRDASVAVAQTPYLTFPGSSSPVERIAGATTDIQHLVHQGSSFYEAAYWVGANALIRLDALDSIHTVSEEGGQEADVFIQDLTVIEDTGSTIDLLGAGWRVHNHFRALAFSATPADFGSLAIQRKRWSNGGLIIFPQLWRQYLGEDSRLRRAMQFALRSHYLLSPLVGNGAVFLLMIVASTDARHMVWAPLAMIPYFLLYGLDLKRIGYRFHDLFAVSALNLVLMPVGFAGVIASVRQLLTGRKAPFSRTPKVAGRTATGAGYILFNLAMLSLMAFYVLDGLVSGDLVSSLVPAANLSLYLYGMLRFIGLREGLEDLAAAGSEALQGLRAAPIRLPALRPAHLSPVGLRAALGAAVAVTAALMPVSYGSADPVRLPAAATAAPAVAVVDPAAGGGLVVDGRDVSFVGEQQNLAAGTPGVIGVTVLGTR